MHPSLFLPALLLIQFFHSRFILLLFLYILQFWSCHSHWILDDSVISTPLCIYISKITFRNLTLIWKLASKTRCYRFQEEKYTINQHFQESAKQFEFINSTCYFILYIYKCKCNCRIFSNYKQYLITCDKQYRWLITFSFNLKVCAYMYTFTNIFWVLLQRKHHSAEFVASMTSNTCSQTWHSYRTPFASLTNKSEKILNV